MNAAVNCMGTACRTIARHPSKHLDPTPMMQVPQSARQRTHTLRVGVPPVLADTLIAPALPRFMQQHGDIGVRLFTRAHFPGHCVGAGEAALYIGAADTAPRQPALRIATLREIICASCEFIDMHGEPLSPAQLDPSHCIGVLESGPEATIWRLRSGSTQVAIAPASALTFDDVHNAAAAAVHAGGFVCLPDLAVESQVAAGLLRPVLPDWRGCDRSVWISYDGVLTEPLHHFAVFVSGLLTSKRPPECREY